MVSLYCVTESLATAPAYAGEACFARRRDVPSCCFFSVYDQGRIAVELRKWQAKTIDGVEGSGVRMGTCLGVGRAIVRAKLRFEKTSS